MDEKAAIALSDGRGVPGGRPCRYGKRRRARLDERAAHHLLLRLHASSPRCARPPRPSRASPSARVSRFACCRWGSPAMQFCGHSRRVELLQVLVAAEDHRAVDRRALADIHATAGKQAVVAGKSLRLAVSCTTCTRRRRAARWSWSRGSGRGHRDRRAPGSAPVATRLSFAPTPRARRGHGVHARSALPHAVRVPRMQSERLYDRPRPPEPVRGSCSSSARIRRGGTDARWRYPGATPRSEEIAIGPRWSSRRPSARAFLLRKKVGKRYLGVLPRLVPGRARGVAPHRPSRSPPPPGVARRRRAHRGGAARMSP